MPIYSVSPDDLRTTTEPGGTFGGTAVYAMIIDGVTLTHVIITVAGQASAAAASASLATQLAAALAGWSASALGG